MTDAELLKVKINEMRAFIDGPLTRIHELN